MTRLNYADINLYVKLEYTNFSGSIKDRAAYNILLSGVENGSIKEGTQIVESSSGNFAIALASMCKYIGIKFIPVIDPVINQDYERYLRLLTKDVEKVEVADENGGYLLTRLKRVKDICSSSKTFFWTNQYGNPDNYLAYYNGLGLEICKSFSKLDYAFIAVSSGGTIIGTSRRLKEHFPNIKIIAVDIEGSIIFGQAPKKRSISGLGSSLRPELLDRALIDDVVIVSEKEIVEGCRGLLNEQTIFGGGSTGAAYCAIEKYYKSTGMAPKSNVLFLSADRGGGYLNTVYNSNWSSKLKTASKVSDAVLG